jgi:hypothetical protein
MQQKARERCFLPTFSNKTNPKKKVTVNLDDNKFHNWPTDEI